MWGGGGREIQPVNETTRRKLTKEDLLDLRCGDVGKTKVWIGWGYPGQGLPYSKWANPFESCDGLSRDEKMSRFEVYLQRSKLMDRLGELEGKTLLCRCNLTFPRRSPLMPLGSLLLFSGQRPGEQSPPPS